MKNILYRLIGGQTHFSYQEVWQWNRLNWNRVFFDYIQTSCPSMHEKKKEIINIVYNLWEIEGNQLLINFPGQNGFSLGLWLWVCLLNVIFLLLQLKIETNSQWFYYSAGEVPQLPSSCHCFKLPNQGTAGEWTFISLHISFIVLCNIFAYTSCGALPHLVLCLWLVIQVPAGTPVVNALAKQRAMLENIMRACIGLAPDNNMMLEYK